MTAEKIPVVDATRAMTATVEQEDRDGTRRSPSRCVLANAIRRRPGVVDVRVGAGVAYVRRKAGWIRYDIERNGRAAIAAYDDAGEVMPIGFRVKFLPPAKTLGKRAGERPGTNKRSGKRQSVATRSPSTRYLFAEPTP